MNLRSDGVPVVVGLVSINQLNSPQILRGHRDVVIDVARDLLIRGRHRRCDVVTVQASRGDPVYQLYCVAVLYPIDWLADY